MEEQRLCQACCEARSRVPPDLPDASLPLGACLLRGLGPRLAEREGAESAALWAYQAI
jgi:hypothetical protein